MPVPPNTTPATAIAITLPFTATIAAADFELAPASSGYVPSCITPTHTVWYSYTPAAATVIGITFTDASNSTGCSIWDSTLTALVNGCDTIPDGFSITLATGGAKYYIAWDANNEPVANAVSISIVLAPTASAPAGSLLVLNDNPGLPATVLDGGTGTVLASYPLPAGEMGDIEPSGPICLVAEVLTNANLAASVNVYDKNLRLVTKNTAMLPANTASLSPVRSNGSSTFYVLIIDENAVNNAILKKISDAGVVSGTTFTFGSNSITASSGAPNLAETLYYFGVTSGGHAIVHTWNLSTNMAGSDLIDLGASTTMGRDICVLSTGDVLIVYTDTSVTHDKVARVSSAGTLLATYDLGLGTQSVARIALNTDNPTTFRAMAFPALTTSRFHKITVVGGADTTFDVTNRKKNPIPLYAPAQSCPLLVLNQTLAVPTTMPVAAVPCS